MQATTRTADGNADSHDKIPELDNRYGKIGISAVAAAVRYQSEPRMPATAPAAVQQLD